MSNFVRKRIDELGRIVIPSFCRNAIGTKTGDYVDISIKEDEIVIKKSETNKDNLRIYEKVCEILFKYLGGTLMIVQDDLILCSYGEKQGIYSNNKKIMIEEKKKNKDYPSIFDISLVNEMMNKEKGVLFYISEFDDLAFLYISNEKIKESDVIFITSYGKLLNEIER